MTDDKIGIPGAPRTPDWSPNHPAVEIQRSAPGVLMLRHPTYPFIGTVTAGQSVPDRARAIALQYLKQVRPVIDQASQGMWDKVLAALEASGAGASGFAWLDLAWGSDADLDPGNRDPRQSVWFTRYDDRQNVIDRTLVLNAGFREKGWNRCGEQGLRVVMHIDRPSSGSSMRLRATSLSVALGGVTAEEIAQDSHEELVSLARIAVVRLAAQFGAYGWLGYSRPVAGKPGRLYIQGIGAAGPDAGGAARRSYSLVVEFSSRDGKDLTTNTVGFNERITHVAPDDIAFRRDPASAGPPVDVRRRGPGAPDAVLEAFRKSNSTLPTPPLPNSRRLRHPGQGNAMLEVRQSALDGGDPTKIQEVVPCRDPSPDLDPLPLRSNNLGAAHAFIHGVEFFERISNYGIQPKDYFRFAKLPLVLRHRAGIRPGATDGETVNAQVLPIGPGLTWDQPYDPAKLSEVEVRFAVADLSHRRVLPDQKGRRRPQYLGLAADSRWAWHEFGHVLNVAATGELELRFAHSIGDALAAVIGDPESALAEPRREDAPHRWRGVTFPWVALNRRHDRTAADGWSWSSQRFRDEAADERPKGERYRAYFAEQLLSSAIFRLYRSIGGDSNDVAIRCGASDYVVYLLMRAIGLLDWQLKVPARTAADFVSALIDADIGTLDWSPDTPWHKDAAAQKALPRVGGCVHKVIRWAFEQQGLSLRKNLPGAQEEDGSAAVDIFIADRRGNGDGGYWPVPLDWTNPAAPWHAAASAVKTSANEVHVEVGNRGRSQADGVLVCVWVRKADLAVPDLASGWRALPQAQGEPPVKDVPAAQPQTFRFDATRKSGEPQGKYYVVVAATCPADRANIDPDTGLPCASAVTPIVDLIANDNNLSLSVLSLN